MSSRLSVRWVYQNYQQHPWAACFLQGFHQHYCNTGFTARSTNWTVELARLTAARASRTVARSLMNTCKWRGSTVGPYTENVDKLIGEERWLGRKKLWYSLGSTYTWANRKKTSMRWKLRSIVQHYVIVFLCLEASIFLISISVFLPILSVCHPFRPAPRATWQPISIQISSRLFLRTNVSCWITPRIAILFIQTR